MMRFRVNKDGTIKDTKTGLIWSSTNLGEMDWISAKRTVYSHREGDYRNWRWRLPTAEELLTLLDLSISEPASSLPGILPVSYWSSTTLIAFEKSAFHVGFRFGLLEYAHKTKEFFVHPVR